MVFRDFIGIKALGYTGSQLLGLFSGGFQGHGIAGADP
jgi:hypothetical protein